MSPTRETAPTSPLPWIAGRAQAAAAAETLKAVAHPLRLQLVALLAEHDYAVHELAEALEQGQAMVSQQLRILRMARLVSAEPRGGFVYYRLLEPQLKKLVGCMERCHALRFVPPGG